MEIERGHDTFEIKLIPPTIKQSLKKNRKIALRGRLWIECNGKRFFGPGPLELLDLIDSYGSITEAAKQMKMSYKKAWEIINTLNEHSAKPFVETQTGGSRGGGSIVSREAKDLIREYRLLGERFNTFLEKESQKLLS